MKIANLLIGLVIAVSSGIVHAAGGALSATAGTYASASLLVTTLGENMRKVSLEAAENDAIQYLSVNGQMEKSEELTLAIQLVNEYLASQNFETVDDLTASYVIVNTLIESKKAE